MVEKVGMTVNVTLSAMAVPVFVDEVGAQQHLLVGEDIHRITDFFYPVLFERRATVISISATTDRSWVAMITVRPASFKDSKRPMRNDCVRGSSPLVGMLFHADHF